MYRQQNVGATAQRLHHAFGRRHSCLTRSQLTKFNVPGLQPCCAATPNLASAASEAKNKQIYRTLAAVMCFRPNPSDPPTNNTKIPLRAATLMLDKPFPSLRLYDQFNNLFALKILNRNFACRGKKSREYKLRQCRVMALFARKKTIEQFHIQKLNERPGSQDTNTSRHTLSSTGHPGHTRRHPQHSRTPPKRLQGSWRTLCGIAHGGQADASWRVPEVAQI